MKSLAPLIAGAMIMTATSTEAEQPNNERRRSTTDQVRSVAPALEQYTQTRLEDEVWNRPGLNRRDRSLVTIAALIARGVAPALAQYVDLALRNGVKPAEISETITHLAYYSGWDKAMAAVGPVSDVFSRHGITTDQLAAVHPALLSLDEKKETERAMRVGEQFNSVAPGLVQYTTDYLFRDLWLRPDLAPRDRSLITVAALISTGQVEQITYHLNRAMDSGLTQEQAAEVITHLAFYAGWPNAMSALPVAKGIFEKRHGQGQTR